jgi:hypothetical protein
VVLGALAAVHEHSARLDQPLRRRARRRGPARREEGVEAQPGVLGGGR